MDELVSNSSLILLPSSLQTGGVAQLELEHFSTKEKVEGSSPSAPISPMTITIKRRIKVPSFYPSSLISHIFRGRLMAGRLTLNQ